MELKTFLLLISIFVNIYFTLSLIFSEENQTTYNDNSNSGFSHNNVTNPDNHQIPSNEDKNKNILLNNKNNELEKTISQLRKEKNICAKDLENANLKLNISEKIKSEEQNMYSNRITIDEDMPDELQQVIASYSAYFISEETDDTWEMDVIKTLDNIAKDKAFQGTSTTIPMECRTTLCKYEVETLDIHQADLVEAGLSTLSDRLGGEVAVYKYDASQDESDSVRVIMYYSKAGHPLPVLK
jgi:low affinity Fe/Cu permease